MCTVCWQRSWRPLASFSHETYAMKFSLCPLNRRDDITSTSFSRSSTTINATSLLLLLLNALVIHIQVTNSTQHCAEVSRAMYLWYCLQNRWTDGVTKFGMGDEVGDLYPCAKFHYDSIRGFAPCPHPSTPSARVQWLGYFFGSSVSLQPRPLHRFSRSIRQMTSFRARMCLLVSRIQHFTLRPHFPPKTQIFGQFLTGLRKFRVKKASTMGMLTCKLPLIVIVAPCPMKVVYWIVKSVRSVDI